MAMSEAIVFKKKGRRNFRKKNFNDENDGEGHAQAEVEASGAVISEKKVVKPKPAGLLSFDHGEEEAEEVFKVKKSKESRKLSKQRNKVKKTKEEKQETSQKQETDEKLESLREELSNLGDESEDEVQDEKETLSRRAIETVASDRLILHGLPGTSGGHTFYIPDAAAIHAARKKREMARQLGPDFLPLDDTDRYSGRFENSEKSRLVREDDNDQSDEEGDRPLGFGTKKSNTHPAYQRRLEVEQALAKDSDEDANSEEGDDALRQFEEEQIRKGVSIPQAQQEENPAYNLYVQQKLMQDSGIHVDPNYPQLSSAQFTDQTPVNTGYSQPSYPPLTLNTVTMDMIWEKMNHRIISLQEVHRGRRLEKDKMVSQMETCDQSIVSLEKQMGDAERRFGFFQEMRGYVRDLIECLNEKVRQYNVIGGARGHLSSERKEDFEDYLKFFS